MLEKKTGERERQRERREREEREGEKHKRGRKLDDARKLDAETFVFNNWAFFLMFRRA